MTSNTYVRTPRGEFKFINNLTEQEAKKLGYGLHHYFNEFAIMTKCNSAIAVKKESLYRDFQKGKNNNEKRKITVKESGN